MHILLHIPALLNRKGKRDYNQDAVYPALHSDGSNARFFMVCDGVGGSSRGDVASAKLCAAFEEHFRDHTDFSKIELQKALERAVQNMQHFIETHNEGESMASTLTFLGFNDQGAVMGHIGDSRIYHLRAGRALYKTRDHSLMNEWIAQGIIEPEAAAAHPKRNVVTRAVVATGKKLEIELHHTSDLEANDVFFLCSDGVLEAFSEEELIRLLGSDVPANEAMALVDAKCTEHSNDNYSAYLLRVKEVTHMPSKSGSWVSDKRLFQVTAAGVVLFLLALFVLLDWDVPEAEAGENDATGIESSLQELRKLDTLSIEPIDAYDDTPTK